MKRNHLCLRRILQKTGKAGRIRSTKSINGLIRISDYKEFFSIAVPLAYKLILQRTDILKFIYQKIGKPAAKASRFLIILQKKAKSFYQKIIKIKQPLLLQTLLISGNCIPEICSWLQLRVIFCLFLKFLSKNKHPLYFFPGNHVLKRCGREL